MADGLKDALASRRTVRDFSPEPVSPEALSRLIWAAQGITGEDGKRTAPSAHGLCPLHLRVAVGRVDGLETGLYSVSRETGALEKIGAQDVRGALSDAAIGEQPWVGEAACIVTICADFVAPCRDFADQPPYGRRGERYVHIEAGCAAQNMLLQAAADGLGGVLVAGFLDEATGAVLGLSAPLSPVLHLCLGLPA